MSVSPFDHPYLSGLFDAGDISALLSAEEDIGAMLRFEKALAQAEAKAGVIPEAAAAAIAQTCDSLVVDWEDLKKGTAEDGVTVPALVRQIRNQVAEPHKEFVHFGATSQDVIDTSLVLRLRKITTILRAELADLLAQFKDMEERFGGRDLMGRTRMQQALPIGMAHRINNWMAPLQSQLDALDTLLPMLLKLQFGGAVGRLEKLGDKGTAVKARLGALLDLNGDSPCWHTDRSGIVNFAHWLAGLSGNLAKIGQDITLMAQNEMGEITLKTAGGSSAMPHKKNPVQAELLVTLGRFNATQVSAMLHALVHENERSGASWTLEWMILPQMILATATGLRNCRGLLANIDQLGSVENK